MEVISCGRMSNQRRILLEDHRRRATRAKRKRKRREIFTNALDKRNKGSKNDIPNLPAGLAKPAGQANRHLVHLRPLRASCTSKTFTKYPLTTRSLLFVCAVLFISLFSPISVSGDDDSACCFYSPVNESRARTPNHRERILRNCLPAGYSSSSSSAT